MEKIKNNYQNNRNNIIIIFLLLKLFSFKDMYRMFQIFKFLDDKLMNYFQSPTLIQDID